MRRLAALLIAISGCFTAWASDCPLRKLSISLYSDNPVDLHVFFDSAPAVATTVQLYAADKLIHSATTTRMAGSVSAFWVLASTYL